MKRAFSCIFWVFWDQPREVYLGRGIHADMGISERGKEFLQALIKLYNDRVEPVHYEDVAREVGVSKWTAYDMLKKLANEGLVKIQYVINSGGRCPGRSMVVFTPRERPQQARAGSVSAGSASAGPDGEGKVEPAREGVDALSRDSDENWGELRRKLTSILKDLESSGSWASLGRMIEQINCIERPFTFCAYTAVSLLGCARLLGSEGVRAISHLLSMVAEPGPGLTVLAGGVLGLLLVQATRHIDAERLLASCIEKYHKYIGHMSYEDRKLLFDFVKEAVSEGA